MEPIDLGAIIAGDPTLRELFPELVPARDPRFRYWQTPDGTMFLYTTERFSDGKFGSAILRPTGKGARSGRRKVTRWKTTREVHHSTRRAAKARAYRLYEQHRAA